jgi:hypothetical protein
MRVLHRLINGRPPWIALEQMLARSAAHGEIEYEISRNTSLGFSLHAMSRAFAVSPWFGRVVASVEAGQIPDAQRRSWDLCPDVWGLKLNS